MKAIWIKADTREIKTVDYEGLKDLQRMVGGSIAIAHTFDNGDVVFVDDEGLLKRPCHFFLFREGHQPYAGNGVLVGKERRNSEKTLDPKTRVEHLTALTRFCNSAEIVEEYGNA